MHPRKAIRHAVVALLKNVTGADERVYATRTDTLKKSGMPAISVYTLRDPVRPDSEDAAQRELTRDLKLEIACWVSHSDALSVDDAMDDICEQVEAAMEADRYLSGAAGDSVLEGTVMQVVEEDGRSDPLIGIATLTYSVTYRSIFTFGPFDDFLRAKATHRLVEGLPDDTVPADDGPFIVQVI